ncbi:MAG: hypothetical protein R3D02_09895 [Hyphomicrobiales bacterium]
MANNPKIKDPAEAALSAVEEALKLDFGGPDDTSMADFSVGDDILADPLEKPAATPVRPAAKVKETADVELGKRDGRSAGRRPANDDRASVGNLVYSLQRRASMAPIMIALVLSIAWFGIGMALGLAAWGADIGAALANPPRSRRRRTSSALPSASSFRSSSSSSWRR